MFAFFDTETTGLPNKTFTTLETEPHVMQLAVSLYDESRRPVFEVSVLVALPEGKEPGAKAFETHGISAATANRYGITKHQAVGLLQFASSRATRTIAHNAKFDDKLLDFEAQRSERPFPYNKDTLFCTMEAATPIIKLPPTPAMIKWGHGDKYKPPSLLETHQFFFGEDFSGAHDALIDTRACARVFFHMLDNKLLEV